jgi:ribonuclease HII
MAKSKTIVRSRREREWEKDGPFVGVDEVGTGAIAGPVVAAAVVLPTGISIKGVRDSKEIRKHQERCRVSYKIKMAALEYAFGRVSPEKTSEIGTVKAGVLAMQRAVDLLDHIPNRVVSDFHHYELDLPCGLSEIKVVKGDQKIFSVAAASILAKVERDCYMKQLALRTENRYGWETNVGYRSKFHWNAIREHGVSRWHREKYATAWTPEQIREYQKVKGGTP